MSPSLARLRFGILGLIAVLIAGCGGSGGGTNDCNGGGCVGGGSPTTVTLTFPIGTSLVAAQIGSGAFTVQTLSANTLSLSIPNGTSNYAVAYLCPVENTGQGESTEEAVWEASTTDGTSENLTCIYNPVSTVGLGMLTGSLDASAIQGVTSFSLAMQNGSALQESGTEGSSTANFSFSAPTGNDRVLVLASGSASQGPLAAENFTNQTVPGALNGGNTVVFAAADQITPGAITYNNVPSGYSSPSTYVALQMVNAPYAVPLAYEATTQYSVLPAGATESGDFYSFLASTYASGNNPPGVSAGATNSGGQVSLTFPAPWTYAGPTPAAQPTFTFDYTGISGKTDAYQEAIYSWPVGSSESSSDIGEIELVATLNYQAGSTTLTVPDLSGVSGFLSAPASGTQVSWFAEVWQSSYGFNWPPPSSSSTSSSVTNSGSFTVP
jgi:hypothetical protein